MPQKKKIHYGYHTLTSRYILILCYFIVKRYLDFFFSILFKPRIFLEMFDHFDRFFMPTLYYHNTMIIRSLAQAKRYFDGVRYHRVVPVKALQRLHAIGPPALFLIAVANYRRHHFLASRMFIASFQRFVTRTLEIKYRVVDRCRFRTCVCNNNSRHNVIIIIIYIGVIILFYSRLGRLTADSFNSSNPEQHLR